MSGLLFLLRKTIKNHLLELLRKPAKLILYLLVIGAIVGFALLSLFTDQSNDSVLTDIIWLKGILFLFILIFVAVFVHKGLSNGDVIFDMHDVNLLFVSPISPKYVLLYGLAKMMRMAFWMGFFILFQASSMNSIFGKGFSAILIVFFCFVMSIVILSGLSLVIYTLTNGNPGRKRLTRILAVAAFVPVAVYGGIQILSTANIAVALEQVLQSSIFAWTPIAGWAAQATVAFIEGDMATGLLFFGTMVLGCALLIVYILISKVDYYEDVLVATETAFEKKRAVEDGQVNYDTVSSRKVKVAKTGIGGKGGASTLFYKHLRESLRSNPLGLLNRTSIYIILGASLLTFFMHSDMEGSSTCIVILQIVMWMKIFMIGMDRGMNELTSHYIYMIPESSFAKILWSNLESVVKVCLEAVILFVLCGSISQESIGIIIGCIIVYTLFALLLIAINYVSLRWTGANISAGILMMIYTVAVLLIMAPGLALSIAVATIMGGTFGTIVGLCILAAWELIMALLCFFLSKGVLHRCDITVVNTHK